jgi:anti-sigma B factor antagonist
VTGADGGKLRAADGAIQCRRTSLRWIPEEVADVIATWSVEQLADGTSRVIVTGEVDLAVEEPFVAEVDSVAAARDGGSSVVLDLGGVTFLDSSGVRALIRLRQRHGERLRLGELSAPVRRVLEITGLLQPFGAE